MKSLFLLVLSFSLLFLTLTNGMEIGIRDIRFVHAIPSGGPVDVWVNGMLIFPNQAFQSVTPYNNLLDASTSLTIVVTPAGGPTNKTLFNSYFSTTSSSSWNLLWRLNEFRRPILDPVEVEECCLRADSGKTSLQALNLDASGSYPFVDILTSQGDLIFPHLLQNQISPFIELMAQTVNLKFSGPSSNLPLAINLLPGVSYVVVLWGASDFAPIASAIALPGCTVAPPEENPRPPPPPPTEPVLFSLMEAQKITSQSDGEYITAINSFLSGKDTSQLAGYLDRWSFPPQFGAIVRESGTPPTIPSELLNLPQFMGVAGSFLRSISGSSYRQGRTQLIPLSKDSFSSQFSFTFSSGGVAGGVATKVYTRLADGSVKLVFFQQLFFPAPPSLSLTVAQSLFQVDAAIIVSAVNQYTGSGISTLLASYYSNSAPNYISTILDLSTGSPIFQLNSIQQLAINRQALAYYKNFTMVLEFQQVFLLHNDSFVGIGFATLNSLGFTQLIFFHHTFTRQKDGSFKVVADSQFQGQAVFPIELDVADPIIEADENANLGILAGDSSAIQEYVNVTLPGFKAYYFPTPDGLPPTPLNISVAIPFWTYLANSLGPFNYTTYTQTNSTVIRLSDFSLVEIHSYLASNGTNSLGGFSHNVVSISPWYNSYGVKLYTGLEF